MCLGDYNMKIPRELADFFERYIKKNPQLGYRKISQIILHILQNKAKDLMKLIQQHGNTVNVVQI